MDSLRKAVRVALALVVGGTTAAGLTVAPTSSASALECYDQLSSYKVHNKCAPYVRHWNTFKDRKTSYGPWVTKNRWSAQPVCWVTFTSRGATVRLS